MDRIEELKIMIVKAERNIKALQEDGLDTIFFEEELQKLKEELDGLQQL